MSEQYRPPGSSDRNGLGPVAKILFSTLVVGVLGLVVALGVGVNVLVQHWDELDMNAGGKTGSDEADSSAPAPEPNPSETADGERDGKLTAEEIFGGAADEELKVTLDEHTAYARRVGRWDHQDCSGAGDERVLAVLQKHGCRYGVEQALAAKDSPFWVGNQVLVFPDEASASAAAEELATDRLRFRIEEFDTLDHSTIASASKRFLVASTIALEKEDAAVGSAAFQEDVRTLLGFTHADLRSYFVWR